MSELDQDLAAIDAVHARRLAEEYRMVRGIAQLVATREGWGGVAPGDMLDHARLTLPERPLQFASYHNAVGDQPSELELYFLSKMPPDIEFTADTMHEGALRTTASIMCLRDVVRTKRFLQGITEAVDTLASQQTGPIEVLEAGTGAIPVMLLQAALRSERVHATGIELNPRSATMARQLVAALHLEDRVNIIDGDATRYQPHTPPHLLISETTHSGLSSEPFVQILSNLQPHVRPGGITLPSRVDILAAISSIQTYLKPAAYARLANQPSPVFRADWQRVVRYKPGDDLARINFTIEPGKLSPGRYLVLVASEVEVGTQTLHLGESVITAPRKLRQTTGDDLTFDASDNVSEIRINYAPGQLLRGVAELIRS